jgi:hypothetical protein
MKRRILSTLVLCVLLTGCNPIGCNKSEPTQAEPYRHSLKATGRDERLQAIEERTKKYGVKP